MDAEESNMEKDDHGGSTDDDSECDEYMKRLREEEEQHDDGGDWQGQGDGRDQQPHGDDEAKQQRAKDKKEQGYSGEQRPQQQDNSDHEQNRTVRERQRSNTTDRRRRDSSRKENRSGGRRDDRKRDSHRADKRKSSDDRRSGHSSRSRSGYGSRGGEQERKGDGYNGNRRGREEQSNRGTGNWRNDRYNGRGRGGIGGRGAIMPVRGAGYANRPIAVSGRGTGFQNMYKNQTPRYGGGNPAGGNTQNYAGGARLPDDMNVKPSQKERDDKAVREDKLNSERPFREKVELRRTVTGMTKAEVERAFPQWYNASGSDKSKRELEQHANHSPTTAYFQYQEQSLAMSIGARYGTANDRKRRYQASDAVNTICVKVMKPEVYGDRGDDLPPEKDFTTRVQPESIDERAKEYFDTTAVAQHQGHLAQQVEGNADGGDAQDNTAGGDVENKDTGAEGISAVNHGYVTESAWTRAVKINQNPPQSVNLTEEAAFLYMKTVQTHDSTGLLRGEIVQSELLKNDVILEQRQRQNVCATLAVEYNPMRMTVTDNLAWVDFVEAVSRNPANWSNELIGKQYIRPLITAHLAITHVMDALGEYGLLNGTELVTLNASASPNKLHACRLLEGIYDNELLNSAQKDMKICAGQMERLQSRDEKVGAWVMPKKNRWNVREEYNLIMANKPATPKVGALYEMAFDPFKGGLSVPLKFAETLTWEQMVKADNTVKKTPVMIRIVKLMDVNKSMTVNQNRLVAFLAFVFILQEMGDNGELDNELKSNSSRYIPPLMMEGVMDTEFDNAARGRDMAINATQLSVLKNLFDDPISDKCFRGLMAWMALSLYTREQRWVKEVKLRVKAIMKALAAESDHESRLRIVEGAVLMVFFNGRKLSYTEWSNDMRRYCNMDLENNGPTHDYVTKVEMDKLRESRTRSVMPAKKQNEVKPGRIDRKKEKEVALIEMSQVEVNGDCVKHYEKYDKDSVKWNMDRAKVMNEEDVKGAEMMYKMGDSLTGGTGQNEIEEVIEGVAKVFRVTKYLSIGNLTKTLKMYENEGQLIEYINGAMVKLPLVRKEEMMGKTVPKLLQMTNIVKSSLYLDLDKKEDYRGFSEQEVLVQVLLSLCPNVSNTTQEGAPDFRGAMSILGAYCALMFRGTDQQLRVVAAANVCLFCVAGMFQMRCDNGKLDKTLDPRFGLMSMDEELTEDHNVVTLYRGTMCNQNSVEAELMEPRLPANSVIRAAIMMRTANKDEETDALCGELCLTGVQGYNISAMQLDRAFIERFLTHCYRIRQKAAAVNDRTEKRERYADVIIELCALKEMMRVVAVHSQFAYMIGTMKNSTADVNTQTEISEAIRLVMKSDVQWSNNRVWSVDQDKGGTRLQRPNDSNGNEIEASRASNEEVDEWQRSNELTELYKGDMPPELKKGVDLVMRTLAESNIDNAISLNHLLEGFKKVRIPGDLDAVANRMMVLISQTRKDSKRLCAEYIGRAQEDMPRASRHELRKTAMDLDRYKDMRFVRLTAAVAPVFEMAAGISPSYSVEHVMMSLILKYVDIMACKGLDGELRTALSHNDSVWAIQMEKEGDRIVTEWKEWELYKNIPEVVLYLEEDMQTHKQEVMVLCEEKLMKMNNRSTGGDNTDPKDEDDDMNGDDKYKKEPSKTDPLTVVTACSSISGPESTGLPSIESRKSDTGTKTSGYQLSPALQHVHSIMGPEGKTGKLTKETVQAMDQSEEPRKKMEEWQKVVDDGITKPAEQKAKDKASKQAAKQTNRTPKLQR